MTHLDKRIFLPALLPVLLAAAALPGPAAGQSIQGSPEDLSFKIANATTGQPGTIDRLQIQYSTHRLNPVLDIEPQGTEFTIRDVPIKDIGRYVITAWKDGVPYFWSIRGQKLLEGPVTLHVFDTVREMSDVSVSGLNLLLRKGESVVNLEYMLKVDNAARPQATVVGRPTLELVVPGGASGLQAQYTRGPEPIEVDVISLGDGRVGLDVPLTTGQNQIRLTCSVPWHENLTVPVGANVPVKAWSLLATPENLDIRAMGLEPDPGQDIPGYLRFIGPELEAGRDFRIQVRGSIPAGQAKEVFTEEAPAESEAATGTDGEEKGGNSFPVAVGIAIIVIVIAVLVRRRRS